MGFIDKLFGGGVKAAGEGIHTALDGAGGFLESARSAITGEIPAKQRGQIESSLIGLAGKISDATNRVNEAEAQHSSVFVAGWRPFLGWSLGLTITLHLGVFPLIEWIAQFFDMIIEAPFFDTATIVGLLSTLLGTAGLRTLEKFRGVQGKH